MKSSFFKTSLAYENWKKKYQFGDETPIKTFKRIAKSLASVEKNPEEWEEKFLHTLVKFDEEGNPIGLKCTPGGRTTANAGTTYDKATLMNCFINGPVRNAEIKYVRRSEDGLIENTINMNTPDTPDDLVNIFLTIMEQAKTLASEGGYGINFEFIRPRGSLIKGTGIRHPGIVSYMDIWDAVSECIVKGDNDGYSDNLKNYLTKKEFDEVKSIVKKQTRKGAMLGALPVWHPDIEEFIRAKQEPGRLTKFNISVLIDDAFMKAVENDEMYDLHFDGKVYKRVNAKHLYDLIMKSTYNRAEPGVLFYDNMRRNNPIQYLENCNCTNPCVAEGTLVSTKNGLKKVETIKVGDEIQTTLGFGKVKNIEMHENEEIYRVYFSDGFYQDVTKGHIFYTQKSSNESRKKWNNNIRLKDIEENEYYVKKEKYKFSTYNNIFDRDDGLLLGLYFGDGCFSNYSNFNISVNSKEDNNYIKELYERKGFKLRIDESGGNCQRYYATNDIHNQIKFIFKKLDINPNDKSDFNIEKIINTNKNFLSGLIDGLISSDGDINNKSRYPLVRFKNINNKLHELLYHCMLVVGADYKKYLSGKKGEKSIIYGREIERKNDIYIGIITNDSIYNMYEYIGFLSHPNKNNEIKNIIKFTTLNGCKWKSKIVKIEKIGNGKVYDLFESNADDWNTCGYVSRGCGEIPGNPYLTTVCLLGSVNLTQYVFIDGRGNPKFDFDQYKNDVEVFSRMLDNVNDLTDLPLPAYEWAVKNNRQFGMGLNGVGSTLMMLKIRYGSEESIKFVEELVRLKENITWQTSAKLAAEKGTFPLYDKEKFTNTDYFKSDRLSKKTKKMIMEHGVRNAKTTTNPPLGNTSVICNNVSNGIEPVYDLEIERKVICDWPEGLNSSNVKKILKEEKEKDFVYWKGEFNGQNYYYEPHNRGLCEIHIMRDYGYQWLLENFSDIDKEYIVTTKNLEIEDHINIQEVVQFYCNQSVSKTCNIPKNYSFTKFKNLYLEAWKKGLIGFTTYREGSMESVLSTIENAEEKREIIKKDIKLPEVFINGPTTTIKREGMKFYINFSYLPDDKEMKYPVAFWIHTNAKKETVACNRACKSLAKLALGVGINQKIIDGTWDKCLGDYPHNRLARMISLCMRHNIPREDILVALTGIEGDNISTLLTAVRKFIGETIDDGKEIVGLTCPECQSTLIMESGCFICKNCGHSHCS